MSWPYLWPSSRSKLLPSGGPHFSEFACCFSARSAQVWIQGGAKIGHRGPLQEASSSDRKATETKRMHSNDLEACGKKCCYTPRNEVRGGILESPCPSARLSVRLSVRPSVCPAAFGFPAHNCFPFTPIIMKLHMQTPHEARMCPIDFEVKRSKVKVTMHKLLKMVSGA